MNAQSPFAYAPMLFVKLMRHVLMEFVNAEMDPHVKAIREARTATM